MIEIVKPTLLDSSAISILLGQLGYENTKDFIEKRIKELLEHPDETLLVAKKDTEIVGVISLHFIPQLALKGDFCRISYFCVLDKCRNEKIGALLESYAVKIAKERACDRIEVHCNQKRKDAHRFYFRQGYEESPKYLVKSLI